MEAVVKDMASEQRFQTVGKITNRYAGLTRKIIMEVWEKEGERPANFCHVTGNLLQAMQYTPRPENPWENEVRERYVRCLTGLKIYLGLLRDFPEFREEELRCGSCTINTDVHSYVSQCYERLR